MNNIFYFKRICKIGGTEQFLYEIAKKYKDYDITIYYDEANSDQLKRLRRFVRCKKHIKGEKVICKRAFFNFNIDMIDDVESTENYYCFVAHANFEELGYKPPINHPKLTHFVGVSKWTSDRLDGYAKKYLNMNIKTETCYNPLTLEPKEKVLHLVSAGRLDDKVRGAERNLILIDALERYCLKHNRHYIWHVFSNPMSIKLESPNVVIMKPRVDVRPYIADADILVNLANDMETYGYSDNEAWGYGVRTLTTPLSINKELPIPDGANLICNWDMSNVDKIVKEMFESKYIPFQYKPPEDRWDDLLAEGKSSYEEEKNMKVKVECQFEYYDLELGKSVTSKDSDKNKYRIISKERAEEIIEKTNGAIKIIEEIAEPKKEKAIKKKPTKVEKKIK